MHGRLYAFFLPTGDQISSLFLPFLGAWSSVLSLFQVGNSAELAVSFLVVTKIITSTLYPPMDGQAMLAWVAGYIPKWFACWKTVLNQVQYRVTLLLETIMLPLSHVESI